MSIDLDEVRRIARLAHLELPEPEAPLFDQAALEALAADVGKILDHVRQLEEVDVSAVPPTSHGVMLPSRLRSDEAGPSLETERALAGAPARSGDGVRVPKVVE